MFQRFCESDTVENRLRLGRPLTVTQEKIDEVHYVTKNQVSELLQRVSLFPETTAHRIITALKLYNAQFDEEDFSDRVEMGQTLIPMLETRRFRFFPMKLLSIYMGLLNKHNIRYCCQTNPHVTIQSVMKSPELRVCCAL